MNATYLKMTLLATAIAGLSACEAETVTETVTETEVVTETITDIVEVNSAIACTADGTELVALNQAGQGNAAMVNGTLKPICRVTPGIYNEDVSLKSKYVYILNGNMTIGNDDKSATMAKDTKLTIEAGTVIAGQAKDALVIARDGQIFANGTMAAPIVMTHIDELVLGDEFDNTQRGLWGGVVMNGYATVNKGIDLEGEGFSGLYGGSKDDDNSGVINYLVVKYAGYAYSSSNELNGVAFQGIGHGTQVDYLQVHNNSDDGVEFFGGTVNVKHLVLTGNNDDSLDWTYGWTGSAQYVYIEQMNGGDKGIEADNNKNDYNASPRSNPQLANITIVSELDKKGMETRVGTNASFHNLVIVTTGKCVDFDDANDVNISHSIMECGTGVAFGDDDATAGADNTLAEVIDANSVEIFSATAADASSIDAITFANHAAMATTQVSPHSDLMTVNANFEDADFFGAVNAGNDWTSSWTHAWK